MNTLQENHGGLFIYQLVKKRYNFHESNGNKSYDLSSIDNNNNKMFNVFIPMFFYFVTFCREFMSRLKIFSAISLNTKFFDSAQCNLVYLER